MIFENILVEVYEVLVNVILKLHSNSCGININLSNDEWVVIFIHFEIIYLTDVGLVLKSRYPSILLTVLG